jgi:hypothetical protein
MLTKKKLSRLYAAIAAGAKTVSEAARVAGLNNQTAAEYVCVPRVCSCRKCGCALRARPSGPLPSFCAACRLSIQHGYWARTKERARRPCVDCGRLCDGSRCRQCGSARKAAAQWCGCGARKGICADMCISCWRVASVRKPIAPSLMKERRKRHNIRRNALLAAVGGKRVAGRWKGIGERDSWSCWLCGGDVDQSLGGTTKRGAPTIDHVVPLALGGSDRDENLRLAHFSCNSRRGAGRLNKMQELHNGR